MTGLAGIAVATGARALAGRGVANARSDWAAIPPKVKLAGLAILAAIALVLVHQHYAHKAISDAVQTARTNQRNADQAVLNKTVANYRAAAEQARAADAANKRRVEADQRAINERRS
jgi:hypothetical protein